VKTYLYDLPLKCRGFILRDPYTDDEAIILNARLTNETNKETYIHELRHKLNGDLDSSEDVATIENRTHRNGRS
jgi:hypothetical protein